MTKADIVNEISKSTGIDRANVLDTIEKFMEVVKDSLSHGENVYLRGFGTMEVKTTKEKKARNINAGTTVVVPAQRIVKFKLSNQLKNRMNNGTVD